ncbi:PAS domain-containing protein [Saccharospirillum impatiens]|jgi:PAS domain-containing protein|uniref:PAS domain-containing protein n=1 Tax=Saccharospirillum impatiens TaxID=169438 RepID=UPI0003FE11A3|nr:PAS domain-containing protein [Saccharospirillum impatiens]
MMNINLHSTSDVRERLRLNAEKLIRDGSAPTTGRGTLSVDALELLYRRASDPEHAADALKLLHELQTHQVELDLIYDQAHLNDSQVEEEFFHYKALFDLAPMPYLVVAHDGQIVESNVAAGVLLSTDPVLLTQHSVFEFLTLASRASVADLLLSEDVPAKCRSCMAVLSGHANAQVSVTVTSGAVSGHTLLVLSPDSHVKEP